METARILSRFAESKEVISRMEMTALRSLIEQKDCIDRRCLPATAP